MYKRQQETGRQDRTNADPYGTLPGADGRAPIPIEGRKCSAADIAAVKFAGTAMRPRGSVAAKMLRTAASLSGPGAIRPMRAACRTALAAAALLAAGCMSPHGAVATDVNSASWSDPAPLTLANADTTTLRDVNLFLRCNDRFAEDSLTVRIRMRTPDSLQHEEPFVMVIPPAHTPAAISREADIPYRRRVRFDRTGDYHLTITPCRPVEGVEAVGIHIVKSQ